MRRRMSMRKNLPAMIVFSILFSATAVMAQYLIIGADQIAGLMTGEKKASLIDVRSSDEYQAGHIPGAVNIPAERITAEKKRLPKDKTAPLIFYCRGVG
jgi:rhodanese-related sulfurtransferase